MSDGTTQRKYFAFFESYFDAIDELPKKYQRDVYHAICLYCLKGVEDDTLSGVPKSIFISMKPALDNNRKKSENALSKRVGNSESGAKRKRSVSGMQADASVKSSEMPAKDNRTEKSEGYKKEEIIEKKEKAINKASSADTRANFKGRKGGDAVLRDDSPEKYDNDQTW